MEKINYNSFPPHQSNIIRAPLGEQSNMSKNIFPSSNLNTHTSFSISSPPQQQQPYQLQQQSPLFQPQPVHMHQQSNNFPNYIKSISPPLQNKTSPPTINYSPLSTTTTTSSSSGGSIFPKLKKRPIEIINSNISDDEDSSTTYNIVEVHGPPFGSHNQSQYSPHSPNYSSNQSSPPLPYVNSPTSTSTPPNILCASVNNQIFTLQQMNYNNNNNNNNNNINNNNNFNNSNNNNYNNNGTFTTPNREKKFKESPIEFSSLNSSPEQSSSSSSPPGSPNSLSNENNENSNNNNSNPTILVNTQSVLSTGGAVMPNEQDTWIEIRDLSSTISKIAKSSLTCGITEETLNEIKEKGNALLEMIESVTLKEKLDRTLLSNDEKSKLYPPLTRPRRFRKKKVKVQPPNAPDANSDKNGVIKKTLNLVCTSCGTTQTPEWRKGPAGGKTLCNACGLHYAKLMRKEGLVRYDQPANPSNTSMNVVNLLN